MKKWCDECGGDLDAPCHVDHGAPKTKFLNDPQVVIDNLNAYCDECEDDENIREAATLIKNLYDEVLRLDYQRDTLSDDCKAIRKDLKEAVRFIDGLCLRISRDCPPTGYCSVANADNFVSGCDAAAGWKENA